MHIHEQIKMLNDTECHSKPQSEQFTFHQIITDQWYFQHSANIQQTW